MANHARSESKTTECACVCVGQPCTLLDRSWNCPASDGSRLDLLLAGWPECLGVGLGVVFDGWTADCAFTGTCVVDPSKANIWVEPIIQTLERKIRRRQRLRGRINLPANRSCGQSCMQIWPHLLHQANPQAGNRSVDPPPCRDFLPCFGPALQCSFRALR